MMRIALGVDDAHAREGCDAGVYPTGSFYNLQKM